MYGPGVTPVLRRAYNLFGGADGAWQFPTEAACSTEKFDFTVTLLFSPPVDDEVWFILIGENGDRSCGPYLVVEPAT